MEKQALEDTKSNRLHKAWLDFKEALSWRDAWLHFAYQDIVVRYRGSVLGPFWLVLSTLIQVFTLGFLYPTIFGIDPQQYVPWLTVSLICWQFISIGILDACYVFSNGKDIYLNQKIPYLFFCFRQVTTSFLVFLHQLPICIGAMFLFGVQLTLGGVLLFCLGLIVNICAMVCVSVILGLLCLRYRDVPPIIGNLIQIAFLVTPVIWMPHLMASRMWLVKLNPFYYFLQVMRAPLLGHSMEMFDWGVVFLIISVLSLITLGIFSRYRHRLSYWQ